MTENTFENIIAAAKRSTDWGLNLILTPAELEVLVGEIEKFATVLENETGLLNDDTLTSERLEEILRAMKHQADHASELIQEKAAEIERLRAALSKIEAFPDGYWSGEANLDYELSKRIGIARDALEKREAANE